MSSYRLVTRLPARRTMAFLPRACHAETHTPFAPFFRLLEDFEHHSRQSFHPSTPTRQIVSPKFDVKELPDSYQLYGEFPGLDQNNISLEFTDLNTLTVRAHNERHYETKAPEESKQSEVPAEQAVEASAPVETDAASQTSHKATVEDAEEDGFVVTEKAPSTTESSATGTTPINTPTTSVVSQAAPEAPQQPQHRYHVYERTVGSFYRQFNFPRHVDQEAVTASMKNGILSIIVPKKKLETRKITIQ